MAPCDLIEFSVPYPQWALFQQVARQHGATMEAEYGELVRCVVAVEAEKAQSFFEAVFDQSAGTLTGNRIGREYRPVEEHEKG